MNLIPYNLHLTNFMDLLTGGRERVDIGTPPVTHEELVMFTIVS